MPFLRPERIGNTELDATHLASFVQLALELAERAAAPILLWAAIPVVTVRISNPFTTSLGIKTEMKPSRRRLRNL